MKHSIIATMVLALAFSATCYSQASKTIAPVTVSIIQLIATPERFDGKLVSVTGFLRLEHEAYLLYLNKNDYENVLIENALWVDATEEMGKDKKNLELKYVRIIGTFRSGHEKRNLYSPGGITEIQQCQFWSDPSNPLEDRIKGMKK